MRMLRMRMWLVAYVYGALRLVKCGGHVTRRFGQYFIVISDCEPQASRAILNQDLIEIASEEKYLLLCLLSALGGMKENS